MYPSILVSLSEVCFVTTKYSHNFWVPAGIQATHISHRAPPPRGGGISSMSKGCLTKYLLTHLFPPPKYFHID